MAFFTTYGQGSRSFLYRIYYSGGILTLYLKKEFVESRAYVDAVLAAFSDLGESIEDGDTVQYVFHDDMPLGRILTAIERVAHIFPWE